MTTVLSYCTVVLFILSTPLLKAQSAHQLQREGDRQYEKANYREAEEAYRQAEKRKWEDPGINYNLGNAVYQQGHYDASEKLYEQTAGQTKDPNLQADALHNLGNSLLKQKKFQEAVDAYQNSLRLRPGDADTKTNLQLAKKKLKQEQEKSNQNPRQQPQNQQNPNNNPNQQPKEQPKQQPNQQQNPSQQNQQQNQQEQEQPSDGKSSREQARRLLETAVGPADQKNARKYREMDPGKQQARPGKDW